MSAFSVSELRPAEQVRQKILFIDDDPSVLASLHLLFDDEYTTFSAKSVAEGLSVFAEVRPAIVILDLRLPDKSGIDALRELRHMDPYAAIAILTGYSTRADAEESLRLGAADYINKPFDSTELKNRIAKLALSSHSRNEPQDFQAFLEVSQQKLGDFREIQNASAAFLHDVAGPLSGLMAGSDLLNQKINDQDDITTGELAPIIAMMDDNVRYLRALVDQWRYFSDLQVLLKDRSDIQNAIDLAVSQVMELMASSNIIFQIQAQAGRHHVPGNHFAIARVLINLLRNAIEAVSPIRGRIHLTTTTIENKLQLVVSDNGPGISPSQIPQLFLPQFTTKPAGRGFGLFISKKIIEALEGEIVVRSPGVMLGADFIITLPLV